MGIFSGVTKALAPIGGFGGAMELIGAGVSLYELFKGEDLPPQIAQAAGRTAEISRALMDPTSPTFKRLEEEEFQSITQDFAKALKDVGTYNRRMMARTGGMGILDPERRDEALASSFARSYADRKQAARDQARAYLSSALTANQAVAGTYAPMIAVDQRNRERFASAMEGLLDLTKGFGRPQQPFGAAPLTGGVNVNVYPGTPSGGLSFGGGGPSAYTTPSQFGNVSFR